MRRKPGTRLLLTVERDLLKQFHAAAQKHGLQTDEAANRAIRLWLSASPLEKKFPAAARSGFTDTFREIPEKIAAASVVDSASERTSVRDPNGGSAATPEYAGNHGGDSSNPEGSRPDDKHSG